MLDNVIAEVDSDGNKYVRFEPVLAWQTSDSIKELYNSYNKALNENNIDLLLIPMFILDFLCINPFNDGNGRISKLLIKK